MTISGTKCQKHKRRLPKCRIPKHLMGQKGCNSSNFGFGTDSRFRLLSSRQNLLHEKQRVGLTTSSSKSQNFRPNRPNSNATRRRNPNKLIHPLQLWKMNFSNDQNIPCDVLVYKHSKQRVNKRRKNLVLFAVTSPEHQTKVQRGSHLGHIRCVTKTWCLMNSWLHYWWNPWQTVRNCFSLLHVEFLHLLMSGTIDGMDVWSN